MDWDLLPGKSRAGVPPAEMAGKTPLPFKPKFTEENRPKQLILEVLGPILNVSCMANHFFTEC